jgi:heat shock protein HslJ
MKTLFLIFGICAIVLLGCNANKGSSKNPIANLTSNAWVLKEVFSGDFSAKDFVSNTPKLIFTNDGKLNGTDGCNSLMGGYSIEGVNLKIGEIAATRKFCQDVKDREFQTLLKQANSFAIKNDELTLLNGTKALMKFIKE